MWNWGHTNLNRCLSCARSLPTKHTFEDWTRPRLLFIISSVNSSYPFDAKILQPAPNVFNEIVIKDCHVSLLSVLCLHIFPDEMVCGCVMILKLPLQREFFSHCITCQPMSLDFSRTSFPCSLEGVWGRETLASKFIPCSVHSFSVASFNSHSSYMEYNSREIRDFKFRINQRGTWK